MKTIHRALEERVRIDALFPAVVVGAIVFFLFSISAASANHVFSTDLSGENEIPPVETETTGDFEMEFEDENTSTTSATSATYTLNVFDGMDITVAHLHCGTSTENGPPIVFLYGSSTNPGEDVDGQLSEGTITDDDILPAGEECEVAVTDVESLRSAAATGTIYANVHSVEHPNGLIRGQLMEDAHATGTDDDDEEEQDDEEENGEDNGDNNNGNDDEDNGGDDPKDRLRERIEAQRDRILMQLEENQKRLNEHFDALRERIEEQFETILDRL